MNFPQAVILAGGLGTRLGPLTKDIPKPMTPIRGKPFLEWQLQYLSQQGLKEFLLLTGYKGDQIEKYFSAGGRWGWKITYNREEQPLGTGGALLNAFEKLPAEFLLFFGDSFLPVQAYEIYEKLKSPNIDIVMAVYDNAEDTTVPYNVALNRENLVTRYQKGKASEGLTFVEAGVYGVKKIGLVASENKICSFESDLLTPAIQAGRVAAWKSPHRFFDIGTPQRLKLFEERMGDYFQNSL